VLVCAQDPVACKKKEEQCLGSTSGDLTARMNYDFATAVAIGELNPEVLGEDGYYAAAANCTLKTTTIEVPFFEGGDSFSSYAVRMRIRCTLLRSNSLLWTPSKPLLAHALYELWRRPSIPPVCFCSWHDRAQPRLLPREAPHVWYHSTCFDQESGTSLRGRRISPCLRQRATLSAATPSATPAYYLLHAATTKSVASTSAAAALLRRCASPRSNRLRHLPHAPPRSPLGRARADAEDCIPIPTATTFGTDLAGFTRENADASVVEWRSACLWARRAIDKRIRAKSCFSGVISPSPPPPPTSGAGGVEGAQANIEREEDRRVDGDDAQYGGVPVDPATFYAEEVKGGIAETTSLIQALGNSNPILRNLLAGAIGEMETSVERVASGAVSAQQYSGRRLMQRRFEYVQLLSDALVDHQIMKPSAGTGGYGKEGIPGVTVETCEALCEGLSVAPNASDATQCESYAFRRAAPFSLTDVSGRCYLLRSAGSCRVEDFAAQLYTRQIESERQCHAPRPGYDNPLCIGLPSSRTDTVSCSGI
jgi:hypothetical protein